LIKEWEKVKSGVVLSRSWSQEVLAEVKKELQDKLDNKLL